jgi:hypothetical protein
VIRHRGQQQRTARRERHPQDAVTSRFLPVRGVSLDEEFRREILGS